MTSNNGWPGKPGVPMDPEEPGYHWVKGCDGEDTIVFWRGHGGDTHYENGDLKKLDHWSGHPMWIAQEWTYLGPCLTPDEATALQKRVAELEGALRFYADPFKYTDIHGDDVRVPHFYSETDFGETARVALGLDEPWSLQP